RAAGRAGRSRCHSFLPASASKQNTTSRCSPAFFPAIAVQNTRPAATVGEPMPSPSSFDQRTFFVREKCSGSDFFEDETPLQLGPRNCGQSSAVSWGLTGNSSAAMRGASHPTTQNCIRELLEGDESTACSSPLSPASAERP